MAQNSYFNSTPSSVFGNDDVESDLDMNGNMSIEKYAVNLNKKAKEGKIDPLIGREDIINKLEHILCRRDKNNPILVGDAGVGKTAVAEGLALKIVEGGVSSQLALNNYILTRLRIIACWNKV